MRAYVLINTGNFDTEANAEIVKELLRVSGVQEAYSVFGVYDIIAKVEAETQDEISKIATGHIRNVNGIKMVLTLLPTEGFYRGENGNRVDVEP